MCLTAGMDGFIAKPTTLSTLLEKLDRWLPIPDETTASFAAYVKRSASAETMLPIDLSVIAATFGRDAAGISGILAEFRRANDQDAADLRQAVARRDLAEVTRASHRMIGASRMVGARGFPNTCGRINHASRAGDWATVTAAMPVFEQEWVRLNAYIESI